MAVRKTSSVHFRIDVDLSLYKKKEIGVKGILLMA